MDKIIVVYGQSGVGKTTVINDIYSYLLQNGATVVSNRQQIGGDKNDFYGVLSYSRKNVAFLSMGDYRTTVDRYVNTYKTYDVFITALNTRFAEISTDWLKNSNVIYKVDKMQPNSTDNQKVLTTVVSLI